MPSTIRREFLQLADTFDPNKHQIGGFYVSEKLDGTRCFWDGGLTRGMPTSNVPWASVTDPKTGKRKAKIKPTSTGLWSRYGNPIIAPDSFLNTLPACPLDGELWAGRGKFQLCRSICGGDDPDHRFELISYACYSAPPLPLIFANGQIKNTNMICSVMRDECEQFVLKRMDKFGGDFKFAAPDATFEQELLFLRGMIEAQNDSCFMHQQIKLPADEAQAREVLNELLAKVLDQGGEGVVIRNPAAQWTPKRHKGLLKYKPYEDAEGAVVGFTSGRETTRGSRLLGKIGALILDYKGKRLELAGLTDEERELANNIEYARGFPGTDMPHDTRGTCFSVGQIVTFKFRELSDDGVPKEARYWRPREGVE